MDTKEKKPKITTEESEIAKKNNATTIARLKGKNLYQVFNSLTTVELKNVSNAIEKIENGRTSIEKYQLVEKLKNLNVTAEEFAKLINK